MMRGMRALRNVILCTLVLALVSCGGSNDSSTADTSDFATITDVYISPNPMVAGQRAAIYTYVEEASLARHIKYFHYSTNVGGSGKAAVSNNSTLPFWHKTTFTKVPDPTPNVPIPDPGNGATINVIENTGNRTMTVWFEMNDGTLSNRLTTVYSVNEVITYPARSAP